MHNNSFKGDIDFDTKIDLQDYICQNKLNYVNPKESKYSLKSCICFNGINYISYCYINFTNDKNSEVLYKFIDNKVTKVQGVNELYEFQPQMLIFEIQNGTKTNINNNNYNQYLYSQESTNVPSNFDQREFYYNTYNNYNNNQNNNNNQYNNGLNIINNNFNNNNNNFINNNNFNGDNIYCNNNFNANNINNNNCNNNAFNNINNNNNYNNQVNGNSNFNQNNIDNLTNIPQKFSINSENFISKLNPSILSLFDKISDDASSLFKENEEEKI